MKSLFLRLTIIVITTLSSTALKGESPDEQHDSAVLEKESLAIIVQRDKGATIDSDLLQSLVESEFSNYWQGDLLERKEISVLQKEMGLSMGLSVPSDKLKLGALLKVDYFVLVTVLKDKVICVVNRFPEATIVYEITYDDQLFEESLAQRITVHSVKAINEHKLDKTKLHISVGSFIYKDPFRKYLNVSDTIHENLRERLAKHSKLTVTERFSPSYLLEEYRLARFGLSKSIHADLSAPPADVLVYGKFTPQGVQELDSSESILDFEVSYISPTEMFAQSVESFSVSSNNVQSVSLRIEQTLITLLQQLEQDLDRRAVRNYNDAEFEAFKEQALKQIPSVYSTVESNTPNSPSTASIIHEHEMALRAIQNALMFKGDDSELMAEAARVLVRIVNTEVRALNQKRDDPDYSDEYERIKAISVASIDYAENAYLLNANTATRNAYASYGRIGFWEIHSARISNMMRNIVNSGTDGGWGDHHIRAAISSLIYLADDIDEKFQIFLDFACNKDRGYRPDPTTIAYAFGRIQRPIINQRDDPEIAMKGVSFAEELKENESAAIRALGYHLHAMIYYFVNKNDDASMEQFSRVADLIPEIYQEYGRSFTMSTLSTELFEPLRYQLNKERPTESALAASLKYASAQMEIKRYWDSGLKLCIRAVLPELYERGEYQKGYDLASELLLHVHNGGTYGDPEIVYWKNAYLAILSNGKRLKIRDLDRIDMSHASKANGNMRIYKLGYAFNKIWGINSHLYINGAHGQAFNLSPDSKKVTLLNQIDGMVSGIGFSSEYIGVSTIDSGMFFLDQAGKISKVYTTGNSLLPSNEVGSMCSGGDTFYLGIGGKERLRYLILHELDPSSGTLKNCDTPISTTKPIRWFSGVVTEQGFNHRTRSDQTHHLEFKRHQNTNTVTDQLGNNLMSYEGAELGRVHDLLIWQGLLVFADESGLYFSKLKSNSLQCALSEKSLKVYSLCEVDDQLFVGTSDGLFRIDYDTFGSVFD